MAIYSFNHDSFGKTTNRAGAAGDNAAYNARENETKLRTMPDGRESEAARSRGVQCPRGSHLRGPQPCHPAGPQEAEAWFASRKRADRKNARMSDRFIGALPRELTPEQCIEAVEEVLPRRDAKSGAVAFRACILSWSKKERARLESARAYHYPRPGYRDRQALSLHVGASQGTRSARRKGYPCLDHEGFPGRVGRADEPCARTRGP